MKPWAQPPAWHIAGHGGTCLYQYVRDKDRKINLRSPSATYRVSGQPGLSETVQKGKRERNVIPSIGKAQRQYGDMRAFVVKP